VTDAGLVHLVRLGALKKVFLWQTGVSPGAAVQLRKAMPGAMVNLGFQREGKP
jgi:hypothetical protein